MTAQPSGGTAIVSPLAAELAAVVAAATGLRRLRLGGGWAARGWLAGRPVVLATTGDGARSAAEGLGRLLAGARPDRLLVLGVAGGLSPGMATGDLVAARSVLEWRGDSWLSAAAPDPEWLARAAGPIVDREQSEPAEGRVDGMAAGVTSVDSAGRVRAGVVVGCDRILVEAREKAALYRRLRRSGLAEGAALPAVCDLESGVYARLAAASGIPFLVVRAVLDPAEEELPIDFNLCRAPNGEVSNARVVTRVLARGLAGRSGLPALLGLRARLRLCARRLAGVAVELAGDGSTATGARLQAGPPARMPLGQPSAGARGVSG